MGNIRNIYHCNREYVRFFHPLPGHCPGNSRTPCMRWDTPNAEFQYMFDYVKDGYNKPVAIKVLSPGLYTVYAQLAISGPDTRYIEDFFPNAYRILKH